MPNPKRRREDPLDINTLLDAKRLLFPESWPLRFPLFLGDDSCIMNPLYRDMMRYRTGVQILAATIAIEADSPDILPRFPLKVEVPSLLTDFRNVVEIPFSGTSDGRIVIENTRSQSVEYSFSGGTAFFRGPFCALEKKASDIRYSLWGNQGLLYRFALHLLEARHGLFSFHAAGLFDERNRRLYVIAGGAGSGKTVYLLSGIANGLKLFSTETVHFGFTKKGLTWFMGSLVDNIRLGTLIHDFPRFCPEGMAGESENEIWRKKIALDLTAHQTARESILKPRVVLIFPHIEKRRSGIVVAGMSDARTSAKAVFDNLSQKIAETVVLYDRLPVPGFDSASLALGRLKASASLVRHKSIERIVSVHSNPAECWGNFLKDKEACP